MRTTRNRLLPAKPSAKVSGRALEAVHIRRRLPALRPASKQSDLAADKSSEEAPIPETGLRAQELPKTIREHRELQPGGVLARRIDIHHPPLTHTFGASDADNAFRTRTRALAGGCRKADSTSMGMQKIRTAACAQSRG